MVLSVIYFSLHPRPPDVSSINFGDKLVHFSAYFVMCLWFVQLYFRQYHWRPMLGLVLLGCFIEIAQGFTEYRSFELADMMANSSGVILAWVITGSKLGLLLIKFEHNFLLKRFS